MRKDSTKPAHRVVPSATCVPGALCGCAALRLGGLWQRGTMSAVVSRRDASTGIRNVTTSSLSAKYVICDDVEFD